MRSSVAFCRHTLVTSLAALVGLAGVLNAAVEPETADGFLQRVLAQTTRAGIAARAVRHLEAGTASGKHHGWMDVETSLSPGGAFRWNVIGEGGSERTREKVFRAILEGETDAWRAGTRESSALSPANYHFAMMSAVNASPVRIRLTPRRSDPQLIDGTLTVTSDGYPLLLQGRLAKSPSFWVKSVTVVKRYGRFGGVALPVTIESLADVKMFGKSVFSMRYRYTEVNGRTVSHVAAAAPSFGPSAEILELFASRHEGQ